MNAQRFPACRPGWLLEAGGNFRPRGMTVQRFWAWTEPGLQTVWIFASVFEQTKNAAWRNRKDSPGRFAATRGVLGAILFDAARWGMLGKKIP